LRHQLAVYKRTVIRPRLRRTDRVFWIALARVWPGWRRPLLIVTPDTVLRWQRRRFREYWTRLSGRSNGGRPPLSEKVALFRSRFRGRDDIYPRFWSNARTGRKGYAPACANEWVRGVCEKPRVKCGECPNQAFLPVEDKVILDHLQGRHVVGVYPLLTDDTCWLLAADFDKASWTDDVAAFAETCRAHGLPAAVERSRSGNGAHVWFSFSGPWPRQPHARWAAISSPKR
jgi:hypothetical protein